MGDAVRKLDGALSAKDSVHEAILLYAASQRAGDKVVEAWLLVTKGGLSTAQVAAKLKVHPETVRRWLRKCKALVEGNAGQQVGISHVRGLSADDVIAKRARLLAEAERKGKLDLQAKLLDSEQRRLGLDVSRVESVSVVIQAQSMTPTERSSEIVERVTRLMHRGMLPPSAVDALGTHTHEGAGAPPRPHPHARPQGSSWKSLPKNPKRQTSLGTDAAHGFPVPPERGVSTPFYREEEERNAEGNEGPPLRAEGEAEWEEQAQRDSDLPSVDGPELQDRAEAQAEE